MYRRALATAVALAMLPAAPARQARAQPAAAPAEGYDTVVLKDGTVIRGTILELAPGRAVTIAAAVGGTRTIAWADVASSAFAGEAPAPSPALPEGPGSLDSPLDPAPPAGPQPEVEGPAAPASAPGPSRPRLTIELTRKADVHLLETGGPYTSRLQRGAPWMARSVCRAPCAAVIDARAGYPFFFGGERIPPSRQFYLTHHDGDLVARVRPGRWGLLASGIVFSSFGYAGTLGGAFVTGLTRDDETRTIGAVVLGVGLALLVSGIGMLAGGTTRYRLRRR